jgi:hypothetical protein
MLKRSRPDAFDQMSVLTTPATARKSRRIHDENFIETMSPLTPGSAARSFHTLRTEHVDRDPFTPIKMREYEREQRDKEANEHLARDDGSVRTAATEAATKSTIIMSDNGRSMGGKRLTRLTCRQRRKRTRRTRRTRRTK